MTRGKRQRNRRPGMIGVEVLAVLVVSCGVILLDWAVREQESRQTFQAEVARREAAGVVMTHRPLFPQELPADRNPALSLIAAAEAIHREGEHWGKLQERLTSRDPAALDALLREQADALKQAATALDGPARREIDAEGNLAPVPPIDWLIRRPEIAGEFISGDLREKQELALLMNAAAMRASMDGQDQEAFDWARRLLDYADTLDQTPFTTDHRTAVGIRRRAADVLASRSDWDADPSPLIARLLDDTPRKASVARAMEEARIGYLNTWRYHFETRGRALSLFQTLGHVELHRPGAEVENVLRSIDDLQRLLAEVEGYRPGLLDRINRLAQRIGFMRLTPDLRGDLLVVADYMRWAREAFLGAETIHEFREDAPPHLYRLVRDQALADGASQEIAEVRGAIMSSNEPDFFETVTVNHFESTARLRLAATVLAIAAYRLDHDGGFPPSLQALVPEYLPAVPRDPLAEDAPVRYDRSRRRLWSVGEDLDDDGGISREERRRENPRLRPHEIREQSDDVLLLE